jgi:hypothetical protein
MPFWFWMSTVALIFFGITGVTQKLSTNRISFELSFVWFSHPAYAVTDRTVLHVPARTGIVGVSLHPSLGIPGQRYAWPLLETPQGEVNLSKVIGPGPNLACGHYATDLERAGMWWSTPTAPKACSSNSTRRPARISGCGSATEAGAAIMSQSSSHVLVSQLRYQRPSRQELTGMWNPENRSVHPSEPLRDILAKPRSKVDLKPYKRRQTVCSAVHLLVTHPKNPYFNFAPDLFSRRTTD